MSATISTPCVGTDDIRGFKADAYRIVEAQHRYATRKLVDTDDEQYVLEALIDAVKPPRPSGVRFAGLHYLLYTPFRYPPLRHGSRFGTRYERGIWYGASHVDTALAEKAYYDLVFLEGSSAKLTAVEKEYTSFQIGISTDRGVDLCLPGFDAYRDRISSPVTYAYSQPLGRWMRESGVDAFSFDSARDPEHKANIALFEPAFTSKRPASRKMRSWHCLILDGVVSFIRKQSMSSACQSYRFDRGQFVVDGVLPAPGLGV